VADALNSVGYPIICAFRAFPDYPGPQHGQCRAPDEVIAEWCAQTEHVLISTDEDFRGKWVRNGYLAQHGAEVIAFAKDLPTLRRQHERITRLFPIWEQALSRNPYGYRVWIQGSATQPVESKSRTRKAKTRRPSPTGQRQHA
jgi:hypothetical protein